MAPHYLWFQSWNKNRTCGEAFLNTWLKETEKTFQCACLTSRSTLKEKCLCQITWSINPSEWIHKCEYLPFADRNDRFLFASQTFKIIIPLKHCESRAKCYRFESKSANERRFHPLRLPSKAHPATCESRSVWWKNRPAFSDARMQTQTRSPAATQKRKPRERIDKGNILLVSASSILESAPLITCVCKIKNKASTELGAGVFVSMWPLAPPLFHPHTFFGF